ncbi:MAG: hypothetical protein WBA89_30125 [Microcoleus sp.]|uniref:hypothetical protein n=1 Tax=Microcoleus sp. TaxID=44472 RepID=UPI003C794803
MTILPCSCRELLRSPVYSIGLLQVSRSAARQLHPNPPVFFWPRAIALPYNIYPILI